MKYLKEFANHAAYAAFTGTSEFLLPNVSICKQEGDVHINGLKYEWIEIGGIKWATKNIGAATEINSGLYFQWGDTNGYALADRQWTWDEYKYSSGGSSTLMSKYYSGDGKTVLESVDDAATVNMGPGWRIPTSDEYGTLITNTTSAFTTNYQGTGVGGYVLTDKTDSSKKIFLPSSDGNHVSLWTSSLYNGQKWELWQAYGLYCLKLPRLKWDEPFARANPLNVRGIYVGV